MEDKNNNEKRADEELSNAARRIKALGQDAVEEEEPLKIDRVANFFYHYKFRIIMIAVFAFIIIVAGGQFLGQSNPDINIIYGGPQYITANQNKDFCGVLEGLMPDYNGDGKTYVQLNDLVFMSQRQLDEYTAEMAAKGEQVSLDHLTNKQVNERFTYEIFGGESVICILGEEQYNEVKGEGGFLPLSEIFDEVPEGAIDDYGIRFSETKLCKFYGAAQIFPDDAVLALRRVSTMSVFTGKSKAEKKHAYHMDLFRRMAEFEYPEGYVPESGNPETDNPVTDSETAE